MSEEKETLQRQGGDSTREAAGLASSLLLLGAERHAHRSHVPLHCPPCSAPTFQCTRTPRLTESRSACQLECNHLASSPSGFISISKST